MTLFSLGYREQARLVLQDAVARSCVTLGPDHPDALGSAHHLGLVLAALGDHEAAREVLVTRPRAASCALVRIT